MDVSKAWGKTPQNQPLGVFFSVDRHKRDLQCPWWADTHRAALSIRDASNLLHPPLPCRKTKVCFAGNVESQARLLPSVIAGEAEELIGKAELGELLDVRLTFKARVCAKHCEGIRGASGIPALGEFGI